MRFLKRAKCDGRHHSRQHDIDGPALTLLFGFASDSLDQFLVVLCYGHGAIEMVRTAQVLTTAIIVG